MEKQSKYLVDKIGVIVQAVSAELETQLMEIDPNITGVHYLYGHYNEIKNRLQERSEGGEEYKFRRYPLIALFYDFQIDHNDNTADGLATVNLIICYHTEATTYMEDRMNQVFKPILYPIYESFKRQVVDSGYFLLGDDETLSHTQIDRPHWGDPGVYGPKGYIFNDCLDAIEIRNLKLKQYSFN